MNISYRQKTKSNLKGLSEKDIRYTIMEAMHNKSEENLTELGVLFEFVWKEANPMERKQMIKSIKNNI